MDTILVQMAGLFIRQMYDKIGILLMKYGEFKTTIQLLKGELKISMFLKEILSDKTSGKERG